VRLDEFAFRHCGLLYQREALQAFNHVKRFGNPQGSAIDIKFGDKASHVLLQAADIPCLRRESENA
jgi:hypothetical protein